MGKYRHYQHIVEAVQYNNVAKTAVDLRTFGISNDAVNWRRASIHEHPVLEITQSYGTLKANIRDWIVKSYTGEIYLCNPHFFKKHYVPVNSSLTPEELALTEDVKFDLETNSDMWTGRPLSREIYNLLEIVDRLSKEPNDAFSRGYRTAEREIEQNIQEALKRSTYGGVDQFQVDVYELKQRMPGGQTRTIAYKEVYHEPDAD